MKIKNTFYALTAFTFALMSHAEPGLAQATAAAESGCMAAVNREYRGNVRNLSVVRSEFSQANSLVIIDADGDRWRCLASNNGRVAELRRDGGGDWSGGTSPGVTLYVDNNYRGNSETISRDTPALSRTRIGNDNLSSVRVPSGCSITLFEDNNYRGRSLVLYGDTPRLGRTSIGNDQASSARVACSDGGNNTGGGDYTRGVTLYADYNYSGISEVVSNDIPALSRTRVGNDKLSSVRVPRGCQVTLYENNNYRGRSAVLYGDESDLGRTNVGNDIASSARVKCDGGGYNGGNDYTRSVTLYVDNNYRGNSDTITRDTPALRSTRVGNDNLSSIRIPRGCRVTLYEDNNYRGRSVVLYDDTPQLGRTSVGNNQASSARVTCDDSGYEGGGDYNSGVTLYVDRDFRGTSETVSNDVSALSRTRIGNDKISSVRVPRGCRITLYEDNDFRGRSVILYDNESDLGRTNVGNDQASSIRVSCD